MYRYRGINVEPSFGKSKVFDKFFILAHADEGEGNEPSTVENPPINFEALIAQARKEEKDKLYPRLKKAEDENKALTTANNQYLLQIAALKDEIEKLKNNPKDTTEVDTLNSKIKELEDKLSEAQKNTVNEEEIRSKIQAEFEVKMYLKEQIQENKDSILSAFVSDITGSTKEEVDASIVSAKEKTLSIKKDLGLVDDKGNPVDKKKKKAETPPTQVSRVPASAPAEEDEETFDAEYVRNLDPRSKEYAEFRKKMGLK